MRRFWRMFIKLEKGIKKKGKGKKNDAESEYIDESRKSRFEPPDSKAPERDRNAYKKVEKHKTHKTHKNIEQC